MRERNFRWRIRKNNAAAAAEIRPDGPRLDVSAPPIVVAAVSKPREFFCGGGHCRSATI